MRFFHRYRAVLAVATLAVAFSLAAVDFADARRGGGFGSRGLRTFNSPAATRTAPSQAQPINRSMTPRQQTTQPATQAGTRQAAGQPRRSGMFGGMFGGLLGGLMLGGLVGMLLGHGIGGMAGMMGLLLQVGIIAIVIMLVMRFMRKRQAPAFAGAGGGDSGRRFDLGAAGVSPTPPDSGPAYGGGTAYGGSSGPAGAPIDDVMSASAAGADELGITNEDLDRFEQLLVEIQAAFTREDYAGLRERCTPEIVSFLSEELSQNAVSGQRNEVLDVRLLQGDIAESWREGDQEYATVALRYESIDVMRDRASGDVIAGDRHPTETTEIWTFVRPVGGAWKLSAIQDL